MGAVGDPGAAGAPGEVVSKVYNLFRNNCAFCSRHSPRAKYSMFLLLVLG